jgi:hypothetical protein
MVQLALKTEKIAVALDDSEGDRVLDPQVPPLMLPIVPSDSLSRRCPPPRLVSWPLSVMCAAKDAG